jgi:predicted 3-demethylubiquinone-9 3-methyltransferase (glyoxalase superfamily)
MNPKVITPCLWFDTQALEAAEYYVSLFPNSQLGAISRYGNEGKESHGGEPGTVLVANFTLNGQPYMALNGGPIFKFTEAVSFQISCDNQDEIDFYWNKLTENGGEESMCGWLRDKYGLSWQITPSILPQLMMNPEKVDKVTAAFLKMRKFDIAALLSV